MQPTLTSQIREARLQKGLSQTDFGRAVGVTKQTVSEWETGQAQPDIRRVARIAKALKPHFNVVRFITAVGEGNQQGRAS